MQTSPYTRNSYRLASKEFPSLAVRRPHLDASDLQNSVLPILNLGFLRMNLVFGATKSDDQAGRKKSDDQVFVKQFMSLGDSESSNSVLAKCDM